MLAWHADGTPVEGWPPKESAGGITTPALGDLDNDGDLEVVAGGWQHWVYAWHGNGTLVAGWPQYASLKVEGSAALGDLDGDGDLEVVVGSRGGNVYAWHGDGQAVAGWPQYTGGPVWSSPALGDLGGDGSPEVVVGSSYPSMEVFAWHGDASVVAGWPQVAGNDVTGSPALADVDGDGGLDVVVGCYDHLLLAWSGSGDVIAGWPLSTGGAIFSSPAIADVDGDGDVEVVVGSGDKKVYVWTTDLPATDPLPWPMFRHDLQRTGVYDGPQEVPVTAGKVAGRVEASGTATPLADAMVAAYLGGELKGTAATRADGTYIIPGLPAGIYSVVASPESYRPQTLTDILVVAGETTEANFSLEPLCTIKGQVRERNTQGAIANATVSAYVNGELIATATTDGGGYYTIETTIPSAEYVVVASKPGYDKQGKWLINVVLGQTTYVNFALQAAVLKGQVTDRLTGQPIIGAWVDVYPDVYLHGHGVTQAPYGVYRFRPGGYFPPGTYTVVATMPGYVPQYKRNVVVVADQITYCNFALDPITVLKGQVSDQTIGQPLDGATVDILKDGAVWRSGLSQPPWGVYEMPMYLYQGIPGGECVVRASKPGYVHQEKWGVTIGLGGTTYVNFVLQRSGKLKGQVTDTDTSLPLVGAVVRAYRNGVRCAEAVTTQPYGMYEMDSDLPAGTFVVVASKPGYSVFGRTGIAVAAGTTAFVNFPLQPQ